jgi:hypothetical protein
LVVVDELETDGSPVQRESRDRDGCAPEEDSKTPAARVLPARSALHGAMVTGRLVDEVRNR